MTEETKIKNTKELRDRIKLVQQKTAKNKKVFAEKSGISYSGYRKIIMGKTDGIQISTVQTLSENNNINIEWLITGEGDMEMGFQSKKNEHEKIYTTGILNKIQNIPENSRDEFIYIINNLPIDDVSKLKTIALILQEAANVDIVTWLNIANAAISIARDSRQKDPQ